jgi:hypothetical protein
MVDEFNGLSDGVTCFVGMGEIVSGCVAGPLLPEGRAFYVCREVVKNATKYEYARVVVRDF